MKKKNGAIYRNAHLELQRHLVNKKITKVKSLADGTLWICTYSGLIKYNPQTKTAELLYPDFAFSDVMIDREKNYWFSTLHAGIFRVPNLDFLVWNSGKDFPLTNKLSRIVGADEDLYFATMNGVIGKINRFSHQFQVFPSQSNADIQCFHYDRLSNTLFFYVGRDLYQLQNNQISIAQKDVPSLKSILRVNGEWIWMCSSGTFVHEMGAPWIDKKPIFDYWSREAIELIPVSEVAVATNSGLLFLSKFNGNWEARDILLKDTQILSLAFNILPQKLYALTFEGRIIQIDSKGKTQEICALPKDVKAHRIQYFENQIYIASNKGLFIYDLKKGEFEQLNYLNGLASDNIQDLIIDSKFIWLATGRGLQRIPRFFVKTTEKALIYLRNSDANAVEKNLEYREVLTLMPEVSSYSSHGAFSYAYKINQGEWIILPGNIEQIEIQNIPSGSYTVELKAIDYLGRDSENSVVISGKVKAPFWKTVWFFVCILLVLLFIGFLIAWKIIGNIRKREKEKTTLAYAQMTALKAQMNPHFMYNALNSIQALILQKDIKYSNLYLSQFSSLMRLVLEVSEKEEVSLVEETKILSLYLSLEKLRFGNDFE